MTASQSRSSVSRTAAALRSTPNRFLLQHPALSGREGVRGLNGGETLEGAKQECARSNRRIQHGDGGQRSRRVWVAGPKRRSASPSPHLSRLRDQCDQRGIEHASDQCSGRVERSRRMASLRGHHSFEHAAQHVRRHSTVAVPSVTVK